MKNQKQIEKKARKTKIRQSARKKRKASVYKAPKKFMTGEHSD